MYSFKISNRKGKKYDVFKDGIYLVSFGGIRANGIPYDQFYDKIGKYSKYNHLDESRRQRYYQRHGKKAEFESAKYFSHSYLW